MEPFDPKALMPNSYRPGWVSQAQPVFGTPLMLVHVTELGKPADPCRMGSLFTLVDMEWKPVWSLTRVDEYTALCDAGIEPHLVTYLEDHPAILRTHRPHRFAVRYFNENKRVAFSINRERSGEWIVSEVERVDYIETEP